MSDDRETRHSERRRFLKLLGLVGMSSALSPPVMGFAQVPRGSSGPGPREPAARDTTQAEGKPPAISDEARALAQVVAMRYGAHLTPEQLEAVAREIDGRVTGGKRLREAKLANHDEPDFTFQA
jgi:hypothetical protein